MSNKDRDFYSIKPGFDSKNKELALIRLFYCNFAGGSYEKSVIYWK